MASAARPVITGFGCLTAAGATAASTWESIVSGVSGIEPSPERHASGWQRELSGIVKDYDGRRLSPDRKLLKVTTRQDVIGLNAVTQALKHSGLLDYRDSLDDPTRLNERTGVFVGSPGNKYRQQYDFLPALAEAGGDVARFGSEAMESVHPMWLLRVLPNNVLAYTGIHYGFRGPNENHTGHGVSGAQAIHEACLAIEEGQIDRAIVVGYDSASEDEGVAYYAAMGLISSTGLRPFDARRDGTVLGEGAGAIVIESIDEARARGAAVLGEVLGSSVVSEAEGILSVRNDGNGMVRSIGEALDHASRDAGAIGMVTAHGNGTGTSDASEAQALSEVFGPCRVPVTAFKWSLAHTVTASGVIEAILTLIALREGRVPGIPTLEKLASDCEQLDVSSSARAPRSTDGLVVTRGFGGLNASVILTPDVT